MKDVSCLSASFRAVVDDSGNVRVATIEEGIKEGPGWTATNVNDETALRGIACRLSPMIAAARRWRPARSRWSATPIGCGAGILRRTDSTEVTRRER
jgi:hypothetical protein